MGVTVLPHPGISHRAALVPRARACASRIGISSAGVAPPAAAASKKPKRAEFFREGEPPAKRTRNEGEHDSAAAAKKPKRLGSFRCAEPSAKRVRGETDRDSAAATKIRSLPRPCVEDDGSSCRGVTVAAAFVIKKQAGSASQSPILQTANISISELVAKARLAKATADASIQGERRRAEIQRRRAEARRELEQMVATVEFNDPYIDYSDVLK